MIDFDDLNETTRREMDRDVPVDPSDLRKPLEGPLVYGIPAAIGTSEDFPLTGRVGEYLGIERSFFQKEQTMGEAFRGGERAASATGATKADVLTALEQAAPDADEIRIRTVRAAIQEMGCDPTAHNFLATVTPGLSGQHVFVIQTCTKCGRVHTTKVSIQE